ncbi:Acetyltransferase YpeA [Jeotgalibaca dankookensis]|uniref:Acetyltransferase YpeA n=1 Tax=Jeotgalibaca dankookensis TaxID=708126 RepID=A0A1S6IQ24_9LACT|nr:GNAT family protein [Jeotgalibaca dankookensis]AQS53648.1 Acetyltransferase YpeA [Jeotgalibaca dankookensis]
MKTEKIEIMIREAIPSDAKEILAFSRQTGAETDFLTYGEEGLELSEAFEEMYLEGLMDKQNAILLVAIINNEEIIGMASVGADDKPKTQHVGEVGITVSKEFWGFGLGTALMEEIEIWAKESGVIRRLELTVHSENERAIVLYEKMGYHREGLLSRIMCINGTFVDGVMMSLLID